jgi:hypothetical protein
MMLIDVSVTVDIDTTDMELDELKEALLKEVVETIDYSPEIFRFEVLE